MGARNERSADNAQRSTCARPADRRECGRPTCNVRHVRGCSFAGSEGRLPRLSQPTSSRVLGTWISHPIGPFWAYMAFYPHVSPYFAYMAGSTHSRHYMAGSKYPIAIWLFCVFNQRRKRLPTLKSSVNELRKSGAWCHIWHHRTAFSARWCHIWHLGTIQERGGAIYGTIGRLSQRDGAIYGACAVVILNRKDIITSFSIITTRHPAIPDTAFLKFRYRGLCTVNKLGNLFLG